ncbi:MAG: hypothetical protein ACYDEO_17365 [Aggregatilineales bacterium]
MAIGFPTNTAILTILSMGGMAAALWFSLSQVLERLPFKPAVRRGWRWTTAGVLIAWFTIRVGLALFPPGGTVLSAPYIVGFVTLGLTLGLTPLMLSSTFRQAISAIPETRLVGLQMVRVVGVFFITLLDMKLLPASFAIPAGYGDVLVGVLAVWVVYLLDQNKPYTRTVLILWNILGLLDLLTALITGFTFIPAFAAQLVVSGTVPLYLNYVLIIPTFGVPLAIALHVYTLYKALAVRQHTPLNVSQVAT